VPTTVGQMSNISSDRIDDVAPGDIITVEHDTGETQHTAVYTVTFEGDDSAQFLRARW
jgi:hypothetical protein